MARGNDREGYRLDDPHWQAMMRQPPDERMIAYVEHLNRMSWVVASGSPYRIASRQLADGTIEHFVDRHV